MHSKRESGSFDRPGLVLPFQHRPAAPRLSRKPAAPVSALLQAQRALARGRAWEDLAWLGLMTAALGLLIASFRP